MPWNETCAVEQRRAFIGSWLSGQFSLAMLCRRFGISRPTGYKWVERFLQFGYEGLEDRSSAPHHSPQATPRDLIQAILDLKHRYPLWGPVPLYHKLCRDHPDQHWPAPSTVGDILKRHGLVRPRKKKRTVVPPNSRPLAHATAPNVLWSADFKGDFALGNGRRCYPLTVTDNLSRLLITCKGLYSTAHGPVIDQYEVAFREYGLPDAIRTDNGCPFALPCLAGLCHVSVWLLKLGVWPERIAPGHPEQNPRHERMHRTLKEATANPPKANLSAQQRAFNRFRREYNQERAHQGLGYGLRPIDVYHRSTRPYPESIPEMEYPDDWARRRVKKSGHFKWHQKEVYLTRQLNGETVGLEPLENDLWYVHFGAMPLGILDPKVYKIIRIDRTHV